MAAVELKAVAYFSNPECRCWKWKSQQGAQCNWCSAAWADEPGSEDAADNKAAAQGTVDRDQLVANIHSFILSIRGTHDRANYCALRWKRAEVATEELDICRYIDNVATGC